MVTLIKILDYVNVIIIIGIIYAVFSLLIGLFHKIFKHNSDELKKFFKSLLNLAEKNLFLYTLFFVMIISITIITSREITFYLGLKNLNIIPNGTYTYYVEMTKKSSGKTYTEPAVITKESDCYEDEEHEKCYPMFFLERIYFANGGYITFDEDNIIFVNSESDVVDHKGNEYEVKLLNKHAYINGVIESRPSSFQIFEIIFQLVVELICWLAPIYMISKKH